MFNKKRIGEDEATCSSSPSGGGTACDGGGTQEEEEVINPKSKKEIMERVSYRDVTVLLLFILFVIDLALFLISETN